MVEYTPEMIAAATDYINRIRCEHFPHYFVMAWDTTKPYKLTYGGQIGDVPIDDISISGGALFSPAKEELGYCWPVDKFGSVHVVIIATAPDSATNPDGSKCHEIPVPDHQKVFTPSRIGKNLKRTEFGFGKLER